MSIEKSIAIVAMWIGPSIAIAVTGNADLAIGYIAAMFATVMMCLF